MGAACEAVGGGRLIRQLRFGFIGEDFALGIRTDSLGVQEVIRMSY